MGGDWYDMIPLPNGRIALVIGDVQGHDVRAAGLMGQLRIALRAYASEGHRPDAVLSRASRFLSGLTESYDLTDGEDRSDATRFATCLYAEADPEAGDPRRRPGGAPRPGGDQRRRHRGDPADRRRPAAGRREGRRLPDHPCRPGAGRDDHAVHGRAHRDRRTRHGDRVDQAQARPGEARRRSGGARRGPRPGRARPGLPLHDRTAGGPPRGRHRGAGAAPRGCACAQGPLTALGDDRRPGGARADRGRPPASCGSCCTTGRTRNRSTRPS